MKKGTKFIYYSHQTLQVPRVARQCMVGLCEAAAALGAESEIVSFTLPMHPSEPAHPPFEELYNLRHPVRLTTFPFVGVELDENSFRFNAQRVGVYLGHFLRFCFSEETRRYERILISARNPSILLAIALAKKLFLPSARIVADVHGLPRAGYARFAHRIVDHNACISKILAEDLAAKGGVARERISFAHSGVHEERLRPIAEGKEGLRRRLDLPGGRPLVCYSGKVYYRYEEIGYYLDAAELLAERANFLIVGGRPDQVALWREEAERRRIRNMVFRSFVPASTVREYLCAADLLVMYYSPDPLNAYRSPGKLFEYLASGTPVLASRFAGIEEVVRDGVNGVLVEPYKSPLLAQAIAGAMEHPENLAGMGRRAVETAAAHTWRRRAAAMLDHGSGVEELLFGGSGSEERGTVTRPPSNGSGRE